MSLSNWEADKMLDVYIYDYLMKRNLHASAKTFMAEGKVAVDPVAIDAPGGFLFEWWSVFWDIFIARTNDKHSEVATAYIETQQIKAREQQQLQMQQSQLKQHQPLQRRSANLPSLTTPKNGVHSDGVLGPSNASIMATKMYEEHMKLPHSIDAETSSQHIDASRMPFLKSSTNHQGQLVQGNPGSLPAAMQQNQARAHQTAGELGVPWRSLQMDPSTFNGHGTMQSKAGLEGGVLSQGASGPPLKSCSLVGIDQLRSNLGSQVQKSVIPAQSQFYLLSPQEQQQFLAQAQAQRNIGSSHNYGDTDPGRLRATPRGNLSGKDVQPTGIIGSIGSPIQSSSPKLKTTQMQQFSAPQSQEQIQQQQQMQQNNKKRKQTSSGAANSTSTGNTVGPSTNSAPSPPSTHTPSDGITMAGNVPHISSMQKSMTVYGTDGTGGLVSSNQMDGLEHFVDVGSLDDNIESFLSHDDGDGRDIFAALKGNPADHNTESMKGFPYNEFGCIRTSNSKVLCCHFSTDGKFLASAGHEKKAVLWNMDNLQTESTPEEHTHIITDVRFKPNSTHLATSSFDRTVRLWDAADPSFCLHAFTGHSSQVMSLDFHPKKSDLLCSCDSNGEIRFWSGSPYSCSRISKGGAAQVRFQPRMGHLLAAAAENVVTIFDIEADRKIQSLQGHKKEILSVCWDASGDHLASVSQDCVKVWSLTSGSCIHELSSNGNKFNSCVFHLNYSNLLVIGGYQSLELWNMVENKTVTVQAHEGLISSLAQSPATGMMASASHDKSVKLWK